MVCNAHVVLEGAVPRQELRARAERAVRRVPGALGIRNSILVQPAIPDGDIAEAIEATFRRNTLVNPEHIVVGVSHSEVTLTGTVNSWAERDEVNKAAWAVPGVTDVIDVIDVLTIRR
jgi:osmotically-inducible protein OsmY